MDRPLMVGVSPGVSDEEADEGDVSASDDELIVELMVFLTAPDAISFLGIDLVVPPESILDIGKAERLDSVDGLDSTSSLPRESCDDRGVPILSVESNGFGDSVRGAPVEESLRRGAESPPDIDREVSLISD
jgi:hypothetical protein